MDPCESLLEGLPAALVRVADGGIAARGRRRPSPPPRRGGRSDRLSDVRRAAWRTGGFGEVAPARNRRAAAPPEVSARRAAPRPRRSDTSNAATGAAHTSLS